MLLLEISKPCLVLLAATAVVYRGLRRKIFLRAMFNLALRESIYNLAEKQVNQVNASECVIKYQMNVRSEFIDFDKKLLSALLLASRVDGLKA